MAGYTTTKSSYDRYAGKTQVVSGQPYNTKTSPHLDVPKTTTSNSAGKSQMFAARQDKNTKMNPNRPAQQNRYNTVSGASLGKAPGWQTRGDKRKHVMGRAYSMNQVSMARIMKGNVNANEGAYMKRGGDRQV